jgi:hypothetical protein
MSIPCDHKQRKKSDQKFFGCWKRRPSPRETRLPNEDGFGSRHAVWRLTLTTSTYASFWGVVTITAPAAETRVMDAFSLRD